MDTEFVCLFSFYMWFYTYKSQTIHDIIVFKNRVFFFVQIEAYNNVFAAEIKIQNTIKFFPQSLYKKAKNMKSLMSSFSHWQDLHKIFLHLKKFKILLSNL